MEVSKQQLQLRSLRKQTKIKYTQHLFTHLTVFRGIDIGKKNNLVFQATVLET